jgi:eukaryotic-like serine/threonine-protein kinase
MDVTQDTLVDGRYRVLRKIGAGGMADVYSAEDTHLGRTVALKVLHQRFAQDQEFVERFQREAQAAAGLQHPNVVGVFDRGQFDGTYYIAMEYLEGSSLKDLIGRGMTVSQAVDITRQILTAARFAHRHGIIHRDFKPQNVIVDPEGRARVTDFGIARAGASEITQTGSVMGTAHYLSPEQAQGLDVTAASDLYSIGVILYEMLTGRVPFEADSAVAVALKQVSQAPQRPSTLNPQVTPALDAVVMRALSKDPARRFADADDFLAALAAAESAPDEAPAGSDTAVFAPVPVPGQTALKQPDAAEAAGIPTAPPEEPPSKRRRKRWPWVVGGLVLLALAAFALWYFLLRSTDVTVPNVIGRKSAAATRILQDKGFEVNTRFVKNRAPFDTVTEQDPTPGTNATKHSTVTLTISSGPGTVAVPPVAGLSVAQAKKRLKEAGFRVSVLERFSDSVPEGAVIGTDPDTGIDVKQGSTVKLLVSKGPNLVSVPPVIGLDRAAAENAITNAGLTAQIEQRDDQAPKNQVIDQSPDSGTPLRLGSTVTIVVSTGKVKVNVPDVRGRTESTARSILQGAGLKVSTNQEPVTDQADDGKVVDQSPQGGSQVDKGSTVTIFVGKFAAQTQPSPPSQGQP